MTSSINPPGALPAVFISPGELEPGLTLVTGPRDAGKTRWCMDLAERARAAGMDVRGLVSPAIIEAGLKAGYELMNLADGERRRLAYRISEQKDDLATRDWQMVLDTLVWGNEILRGIIKCDLFILDEAGPLEFVRGVGLTAGLDLLDKRTDFPCFLAIRPSLVELALKRWPWAKVLDISTEAKP